MIRPLIFLCVLRPFEETISSLRGGTTKQSFDLCKDCFVPRNDEVEDCFVPRNDEVENNFDFHSLCK